MTGSGDDACWSVYIIECRDGSLYTGITNNIEKRIAAHNDGTAARFTRGRGPVVLRYLESQPDRSSATKRETQIKKCSRSEKLRLIALGGSVAGSGGKTKRRAASIKITN
ncbi:MAG TPA: GIY-YIG nuclease family protein [Candidatus Rifleibacterium sp.]|nr:GIY-YIG nuclease family protein [Candidatus Rifleibacterium sp.]HPT45124.1 GIY-YIG nuclease family protein [Candidatus Rifleibacterium sp.]